MTNLIPADEQPPILGELGGDCLCGRGAAIGTCVWSSGRIWFRAFHDDPASYHLARVLEWACVDCVADAALAVASGEIREAMRRIAEERRNCPA